MIFKDDFPAAGLAALCLALLFAIYAATGWLVVRLTGAWCPFRVKRPLIPLIGYAATTLFLFYIHLIVPMAGMLPAVGILPALAGAGLWLKERRWGRVTSAKT
ncbi:MAG: hypothetical protein H7Y20_04010, partial [Bryobacteraceae bacterium]|nr:hypothetical protein [Bryobacteraceae bacterium]